jgi:hypothetical protein
MATKTDTVTIPYKDPANEAEWAADFLTAINAPVNEANLTFITAAELYEDTFHASADFIPRKYGDDNANNPLDSTQFEAGGVVWAENGGDPVWQFPTLQAGLKSNAAVIEENPGDQALLADLRKGNQSAEDLAADIAASDWGTGGGPGSSEERGYSIDISDELQDALAEVQSGLRGGPTKATEESFPWQILGGVVPITFGETGNAPKAIESQFVKDLKSAWPYALMIVGIIGGVAIFGLGAYKAASPSGKSGSVTNIVQEHPEIAEAAA